VKRAVIGLEKAHGVVALETQEFWEEENRHRQASIYIVQVISRGSRYEN
jgi:hypothetical protein